MVSVMVIKTIITTIIYYKIRKLVNADHHVNCGQKENNSVNRE